MLNRSCRVCGLPQEEPPWGDDGKSPTFAICSCCGVEFGYEDTLPDSVMNYRKRWLAAGAQWFDATDRPPGWDVQGQLALVPVEFR